MIVKFVNSVPKNNFFIYRNVVLYFSIKDKKLLIKGDIDKNNKYLNDAIKRLKDSFGDRC